VGTNFVVDNMERLRKGEEVFSLAFTSLCRFPVYEADFGWGKPVWVASARLLYKNLVGFFDRKSRYGLTWMRKTCTWLNSKSTRSSWHMFRRRRFL
jgi:hypothetical protein